MNDQLSHSHAMFARIVVFLAGFPPGEIWRSFAEFEDDCQGVVELLELMTNEAKPILEERARGRK